MKMISLKDKTFRIILFCTALFIVLITGGMLYSLTTGAMPAFEKFGFVKFIFSSQWSISNSAEYYGAGAFIIGTLATSIVALLICLPFSIMVSLFIGEYFKGKKVANLLQGVIDLLAGIPSIVYGLWGFYVLRPIMVSLHLPNQGFGILTSAIVLAIMIIPYSTSLSAEFIGMVSPKLKEGGYSLGGTRGEVIRYIVFPTAGPGIISAYILALGRALGETMAVTMLIGNTNQIPLSLTDTGNTMASIIANQFGEADGLKLSSLIAIGLLLFLITASINFIGRMIIKHLHKS